MKTLTDKQVQVNGVNISYTDRGTGKPIVFIHGFPFNKSSWEDQLTALEKNHRVIAFDIRGFGQSEKGEAEASIDLYASDLLQLISELKLGKVTACGLSMGGYILMNAVCREPEKFSTIVLCDTQCIADSKEGREKRFKTIEKINAEGLEKFAEGFVQNMFWRETLENNKELVDRVKQMITSQKKETVTGALKALAGRKETCNGIKSLKIPALIICGKEDTVTPLSQSELLNNSIPGSRLQVIENAAHLSNLEKPNEFNRILVEFLTTV